MPRIKIELSRKKPIESWLKLHEEWTLKIGDKEMAGMISYKTKNGTWVFTVYEPNKLS
jgi:hypothetical protein